MTVRIRPETHSKLKQLAERTGCSMQQELEYAVEEREKQLFWRDVNDAYKRLREDPVAWQEELEERARWDSTLLDGLEDDEWSEPTAEKSG